jgi:hypothetical protein
MEPTLVLNPADDGFTAYAQVLIDEGVASIEEFQRRLRSAYPKAVVHARELAAESDSTKRHRWTDRQSGLARLSEFWSTGG